MQTTTLFAPLAGWVVPLAEVPDPVFAGRMAGDGLAIDPTSNVVYAPCAGEVLFPPHAHHAVSIRAVAGFTVLIHVGIETVALAGEGFERLVDAGASVRTGEPLLRFDLDAIARRARSAVTPIVFAADAGAAVTPLVEHRGVRVGEPLITRSEATADAGPPTAALPAGGLRRTLRVPFDHGLHARPAAMIAAALKSLRVDARAEANGRAADLRSVTGLMSLGVRRGDPLRVIVHGADAVAAIEALEALLTSTATATAAAVPPPRVPPPQVLAPSGNETQLAGVIAVPGVAVGTVAKLVTAEAPIVEAGAGFEAERAALDRALEMVRGLLRERRAGLGAAQAAVLAAHLELLDDPELAQAAARGLRVGKSAAYAWRSATRDAAAALRALDDERIAERAADLTDLESRVLQALSGAAPAARRALPPRAIIVADELLPSQFLALDLDRVAGIAMAGGGATSHVAIIAAAHGIPVLVALGERVFALEADTIVILDAEAGVLHRSPDAATLRATEAGLARRAVDEALDLEAAQAPCISADGVAVTVYANLGALEEAHFARSRGADGCGLLRTEFLYLERAAAPDEALQAQCYQSIATALEGLPLTIRTLDAGGDKPIPYLPLPHEENPALGLRGIRTSLFDPRILRAQLRAILRVEPADQCRILLPMICGLGEIRAVRGVLEEACAALGKRRAPPLGIMIETPAAALLADQLAAEVDFLSIGTNDLSQYTLAMDRGHPQLAAQLDALHPAVLRLIRLAVEAGHRHGRPVAVCGGLASDPVAIPVLLGLGIRELSAVPALIPGLKRRIRGLDVAGCRGLADLALQQIDARAVRGLVRQSSEG